MALTDQYDNPPSQATFTDPIVYSGTTYEWEILLQGIADFSDDEVHELFIQLIQTKDAKHLQQLLAAGARPKIILDKPNETILHVAVQQNHLDSVDLIARYCPELLNITNKQGHTPLYQAVYQKFSIIVENLITQHEQTLKDFTSLDKRALLATVEELHADTLTSEAVHGWVFNREMDEKITPKDTEIKVLQKNKYLLRRRIDTLEQEKDALNHQIHTFETKLKELQTVISKNHQTISSLKDKNSALQAKNQEISKVIREYKNTINKIITDKKLLETDLQRLKIEVEYSTEKSQSYIVTLGNRIAVLERNSTTIFKSAKRNEQNLEKTLAQVIQQAHAHIQRIEAEAKTREEKILSESKKSIQQANRACEKIKAQAKHMEVAAEQMQIAERKRRKELKQELETKHFAFLSEGKAIVEYKNPDLQFVKTERHKTIWTLLAIGDDLKGLIFTLDYRKVIGVFPTKFMVIDSNTGQLIITQEFSNPERAVKKGSKIIYLHAENQIRMLDLYTAEILQVIPSKNDIHLENVLTHEIVSQLSNIVDISSQYLDSDKQGRLLQTIDLVDGDLVITGVRKPCRGKHPDKNSKLPMLFPSQSNNASQFVAVRMPLINNWESTIPVAVLHQLESYALYDFLYAGRFYDTLKSATIIGMLMLLFITLAAELNFIPVNVNRINSTGVPHTTYYLGKGLSIGFIIEIAAVIYSIIEFIYMYNAAAISISRENANDLVYTVNVVQPQNAQGPDTNLEQKFWSKTRNYEPESHTFFFNPATSTLTTKKEQENSANPSNVKKSITWFQDLQFENAELRAIPYKPKPYQFGK